jgi:chromosome segregation ATPase
MIVFTDSTPRKMTADDVLNMQKEIKVLKNMVEAGADKCRELSTDLKNYKEMYEHEFECANKWCERASIIKSEADRTGHELARTKIAYHELAHENRELSEALERLEDKVERQSNDIDYLETLRKYHEMRADRLERLMEHSNECLRELIQANEVRVNEDIN